ncbi:MAG: nitrilase family protein [Saprospiraceae bacterium]|nr:nitrilase family protein [Saprospiraceae bacterium]
MSQLTATILQAQIKWHDPQHNIDHFSELIGGVPDESDLIILPEMWSSGFTMKAHLYHDHDLSALKAMKSWSIEKEALVIGSLIVKEKEQYFNRCFLVKEGSVVAQYDKKHLFGFAGENRFFEPGNQKLIYEYKGFRLCPMICYDLRFPVWCRNVEDYDILIFSANWPDKRIDAWDSLLKSRSIENQSYVLASNCVGEDVWHNHYTGHSAGFGYDGVRLAFLAQQEGLLTVQMNKQEMLAYREALPFLKDRDNFEIRL